VGIPLFVAFLFWAFLFVAFNGIAAKFLKDYFSIKTYLILNALLAIIITSIIAIPVMKNIDMWNTRFDDLNKIKKIALVIATNLFLVL
jgi:hypothetical protein